MYFQNRYTILSLAVDLLTGFFYILGSVAALTPIPDRIGMYFYLAGSSFLTIRLILRIIKNIFIYDDLKIEKKQERNVAKADSKEFTKRFNQFLQA